MNNSLHLWSEEISFVEEWISLDSNSSRVEIHYSTSGISSGSLHIHSKRSDHWRHSLGTNIEWKFTLSFIERMTLQQPRKPRQGRHCHIDPVTTTTLQRPNSFRENSLAGLLRDGFSWRCDRGINRNHMHTKKIKVKVSTPKVSQYQHPLGCNLAILHLKSKFAPA